MSKYSDQRLAKRTQDQIWEEFCSVIASMKTSDGVKRFLSDLLNRQERLVLARRLQVAALLEAGFTYDEIEETMRVGKHTIARVQRWLQFGREGYKSALRKIKIRNPSALKKQISHYYRGH